MEINLQEQYDKIYSYFKTTTEPFDEIDWNGKSLTVILRSKVVEVYLLDDLKRIIKGFI